MNITLRDWILHFFFEWPHRIGVILNEKGMGFMKQIYWQAQFNIYIKLRPCDVMLRSKNNPKTGSRMSEHNNERLWDAAYSNNLVAVKDLLALNANPNHIKKEATALTWAVRKNFTKIASHLIDAGADVNIVLGGCPLICEASWYLTNECLQLLIQKGAELDVQTSSGRSPLILACAGGDANTVKLLLDAGVDVNYVNERWSADDERTCNTAIRTAILNKKCDVFPLLVEYGCEELSDDDFTMAIVQKVDEELCDAFDERKRAETRALIEENKKRGGDIDAHIDDNENTSLIRAAEHGLRDTVKELLAAGANPNCVNSKGHTALILAASPKKIDIARDLIEAGADVNFRYVNDDTALWKALFWDNIELLKLLLDAKANPNVIDSYGLSPLVVACESENIAAVRLLISAKADVHQHCNFRGPHWSRKEFKSTALETALEKNNGPLIDLLKNGTMTKYAGKK
jgi:ankyrin repeat protein